MVNKPVSRGISEKTRKDANDPDVLKRRNIVNKFVNNSHILMGKATKIDSRNIYANDNNKNKDWDSGSLNLKQYVKKKDLSLFYAQKGNVKHKKSQETKLNTLRLSGFVKSAEQQYKSFINSDKQYTVNPYFPINTDFSKSFGSSIYKPAVTNSSISGKKLASLKNSLVMASYSNKHYNTKKTKIQY